MAGKTTKEGGLPEVEDGVPGIEGGLSEAEDGVPGIEEGLSEAENGVPDPHDAAGWDEALEVREELYGDMIDDCARDFAPREGLPEDLQLIQQRLLDTLQFGVEEVDVRALLAGIPERELHAFGMGLKIVQLSSFCRGNCKFCAASAKPYGKNNRQVLEPESLMAFLNQFHPTFGKITLYDASDPCDYPWILELVTFLENNPDYTEINILSSCPPGGEEVFKALMGGDFRKLKMQLSLSGQNRERLTQNGILDWISEEHRMNYSGRMLIKPVREVGIGKLHVPGTLAAGFACEDETILSPDGAMISEYHISSDLYPNEGNIKPLSEVKRVYTSMPFPNFTMGGMMMNGPRIYNPESYYYDLDDGHNFKTVTALRHLVAYLYSVAENLGKGCSYSFAMEDNWEKIMKALRSANFEMPKDEREAAFYKKIVRELLDNMKLFVEGDYGRFYPEGRLLMDWSANETGTYKQLIRRIYREVQEYEKLLTDR